ncbi:MAG: hypothetical protein OK457_03055 [Thaumarchaeota archaeon]|nr:hypothetical protein [Nitrososphaerota archaeon]
MRPKFIQLAFRPPTHFRTPLSFGGSILESNKNCEASIESLQEIPETNMIDLGPPWGIASDGRLSGNPLSTPLNCPGDLGLDTSFPPLLAARTRQKTPPKISGTSHKEVIQTECR